MKRHVFDVVILLEVCAVVNAGPESFSGKEMKQVAPVPPPCPSWTGFYIGGFAGYKYGNIEPDGQLFGAWDEFPVDVAAIKSRGDDDLNTSGAELGGLIGFNYQWHNWVFG